MGIEQHRARHLPLLDLPAHEIDAALCRLLRRDGSSHSAYSQCRLAYRCKALLEASHTLLDALEAIIHLPQGLRHIGGIDLQVNDMSLALDHSCHLQTPFSWMRLIVMLG